MFLSGMVGTASGGTEKKYYKITDTRNSNIQGSAYPGQYVSGKGYTAENYHIRGDLSGNEVPFESGVANGIATRAIPGKLLTFYFIMPAEDVTIS